MDALHLIAYIVVALILSPFIAVAFAAVLGAFTAAYATVAAFVMVFFSKPRN